MSEKKTEEEWKKELSKEVFEVCRLGGTEPPFSGKYDKHDEKGTYLCAACKKGLFSSETKYDSKSGWPSFFQPISKEALDFVEDNKFGQVRVEVLCNNCRSHLGHVFEDGPKPTHKRFCMNSLALEFMEL